MHRILIDIEGGQAVMVWSDLDPDKFLAPIKVFVRYGPSDIRSCPEWNHDQSKHISEILDEAGLFCDHCEEHFSAERLISNKDTGAKYCKHCLDYLEAVQEIELEEARERELEGSQFGMGA